MTALELLSIQWTFSMIYSSLIHHKWQMVGMSRPMPIRWGSNSSGSICCRHFHLFVVRLVVRIHNKSTQWSLSLRGSDYCTKMATEMTPSATNLFCAPRSRDRCLSEVPLFTNGFHPVGHSKYSKRTSSIKVKRVTDRVDLDLDLWPSVSIPGEPC